MNQWNEGNQRWDTLTYPYITMGVGTGYTVSPLNPGIIASFTGVLNTGDKTIGGLTNSGTASFYGYNLVGNPYPSAIAWDPSITLAYVDPIAWVWDMTGKNYIAATQTIGGVIGAEQGFFVHCNTTDNNLHPGIITIPNSVRMHSPIFQKSTVNDLLTLKVEGNISWDQAQVHINPMATNGYDSEFDAVKIMGSPDAPQLYSMIPSGKLSINSLPTLSDSPVIQFGFKAGEIGNYTITASNLESFSSSTEFYLEDLVANTVQDLKTNPVYTFEAEPGQQENRFTLHFAAVGIPDNNSGTSVKIYASNKTVYVNIPTDMKGSIIVYNMLGIEVSRTTIQSNSLNTINLDVPSGFYLVKADGNPISTAGKVFIR